ncbi:MAG: RDD family protein [Acidobacteriota bacterium]
MDWYYALKGRQAGPVSEPELGQLLRNGVIDSDTLVWRAGMPDWQPYGTVIGIPPVSGYAAAAPPPVHRGRFVYAGFWIRAVAYIIDGAVIALIRSIILLPLGFSMLESHPFRSPWFFIRMGEAQLSGFAISLCYFIFFWTQFGATPGKMVCRLKVVTPRGDLISLGTAAGRYFGQILSGLILCIGFMMAGWDDEKRALHDRLADTRVIHVS